jgi:hypothetical protein
VILSVLTYSLLTGILENSSQCDLTVWYLILIKTITSVFHFIFSLLKRRAYKRETTVFIC